MNQSIYNINLKRNNRQLYVDDELMQNITLAPVDDLMSLMLAVTKFAVFSKYQRFRSVSYTRVTMLDHCLNNGPFNNFKRFNNSKSFQKW